MKIQIIKLERYDSAGSVHDRMSWGSSSRILLVWPRRGRILTHELDLVRLTRHARTLGAQIGLVTQDGEVREKADRLGIPCFTSQNDARHGRWPETSYSLRFPISDARKKTSRRARPTLDDINKSWLQKPSWRLVNFGFAFSAVLILAITFLPHSNLRLFLNPQISSTEFSILANPKLSEGSSLGYVPLQIGEIRITTKHQAKASGQINVPTETARGSVRFTNLTNQDIDIPAGIIVTAPTNPPIRYQTIEEGHLSDRIGAEIDIQVQAVNPGLNGNIPENKITTVEHQIGTVVEVKNPYPISGGEDEVCPSPTSDDITQLQQTSEDELLLIAKSDLSKQGTRKLIIEESIQMVDIPTTTIIPPVGQAGSTVSITIEAKYTYSFVDLDHIESLASALLQADHGSLEQPLPGTLALKLIEVAPKPDGSGSYWLKLRAQDQYINRLDTNQIAISQAGRWKGIVQPDLSGSIDSLERIEIDSQPAWLPVLPLYPFQISVFVSPA